MYNKYFKIFDEIRKFFSYKIFEIWSAFDTNSSSSFGLATFPVLNSHMATILASTAL